MNTTITGKTLLFSLLLGALPVAVGCGSTAPEGDVGASSQAAIADGVMPVSDTVDPAVAHAGHHGGLFRRFDKDGDGKIALADLPDRLRAHLSTADTDKDGFVTKDELHAARQSWVAKMKAEADTNHDGTVSADERAAARVHFTEAHLMKHDANGDQALTADEVSGKKWDHIKKADANGDGRITSDEIAAAVSSGMLGHFRGHMNGAAPVAPSTDTTVL